MDNRRKSAREPLRDCQASTAPFRMVVVVVVDLVVEDYFVARNRVQHPRSTVVVVVVDEKVAGASRRTGCPGVIQSPCFPALLAASPTSRPSRRPPWRRDCRF